jgi:hypothetical protein
MSYLVHFHSNPHNLAVPSTWLTRFCPPKFGYPNEPVLTCQKRSRAKQMTASDPVSSFLIQSKAHTELPTFVAPLHALVASLHAFMHLSIYNCLSIQSLMLEALTGAAFMLCDDHSTIGIHLSFLIILVLLSIYSRNRKHLDGSCLFVQWHPVPI